MYTSNRPSKRRVHAKCKLSNSRGDNRESHLPFFSSFSFLLLCDNIPFIMLFVSSCANSESKSGHLHLKIHSPCPDRIDETPLRLRLSRKVFPSTLPLTFRCSRAGQRSASARFGTFATKSEQLRVDCSDFLITKLIVKSLYNLKERQRLDLKKKQNI